MSDTCEGCKFYRKSDYRNECRRYAPRPQFSTKEVSTRPTYQEPGVRDIEGFHFYSGGEGCGEYEPEVKTPTESELDRSWKQGFSEGLAKGRREAKGEG